MGRRVEEVEGLAFYICIFFLFLWEEKFFQGR
jgi:hypothetical protein